MRRFLALLMVLAMVTVVAGCGGDDSSSENADDGGTDNSDDSGDDDGDSGSSGPFDLDFGGADDEELTNEDVIEVVQDFWEDNAGRLQLRLRAPPGRAHRCGARVTRPSSARASRSRPTRWP